MLRFASLFIQSTLCVLALTAGEPDKLQAGPMIGYVDLADALIWVQSRGEARLHLSYQAEGGPLLTSDEIMTRKEAHYIARFTLQGLSQDTTYTYSLFIDGQVVPFDYPLTFKTQKHWMWRSDPQDVHFAFGSCFYVNDPPFDRPGKPYGGDFEIVKAMDAQRPDFFLWIGDNLYLRESDFNSAARLAYRYRHSRSFPALRAFLAHTPNYALWDDHDYGPNDSDRSYAFKNETLELFKAYWGNPHFGLPDLLGAFGMFSWSDLDFFLMDNRTYRAPNQLQEEGKPYLGTRQLQWLKDRLIQSKASFKFVVIGNQVINTHVPASREAYVHYRAEWNDLMSWLDTNKVNGVVFLSGDRHFTELLISKRTNNYPLYDLTCSPLTSGAVESLGQEEANNPMRVPGTLVLGKRNFAVVNVTGPPKKRLLTFESRDKDGVLLWSYQIEKNQLRGPKP